MEFRVNWHFIRKLLPGRGHILDNGAGPGKYAMELARCGYEVTLTDLTPVLVEQAERKAEELGLRQQFRGFHTADARELALFREEQFDASLMLGPMYHLQEEADRVKAVRELRRVTVTGGLVFVAFMSRIRFMATALMYPQHWKPLDRAAAIDRFLETGVFDHQDEGRFTGAYYFNIDEVEPFMQAQGFESVRLVASSGIGRFSQEQTDYWRGLGEPEWNRVMELVYEAAESPYLLGLSSHLLYIGRKI